MAAVNSASPGPPAWEDRHRWIADQLLRQVIAAKPAPDGFVPHVGMPGGGDIPKPSGLYTYALLDPGVWPMASESAWSKFADDLGTAAKQQEAAADDARATADLVFHENWTDGDAQAAAVAHYRQEDGLHGRGVDLINKGASGVRTISEDIRSAKRKMREAHDTATREIENSLRTNHGSPVGVSLIVAKARTEISGYGVELLGYVTGQTAPLGFGPFPQEGPTGPGSGPPPQGGDRHTDLPVGTTPDGDGVPGPFPPHRHPDVPSGGRDITGDGRAKPEPTGPFMPSMPSLGGSGSPLSGLGSGGLGPLSGLMGGFGPGGLMGTGGNFANPAGLQGQAAQAISQAMNSQFGSGLAAGAGGMAPALAAAQQAVPKAPLGPLAAPVGETAPVSAAPVSAAVAPAAAEAPLAAPAGGGGMGAPMTPYGSVLPPSAATTSAGGGALGSVPPPPPPNVPPGGGGGAGGPGLVPAAVRDSTPTRVRRETSMTDLELARATVADLAAASCVVNPGLDWAVAIARGASGLPEMWIATNEGAGYIPVGVYLPRSAPLAAGLDADFDARWFGWFNPAETALRAIRDRGDVVSAIATTWVTRSELISDAVEDVALGVAPSGGPTDAEASRLTRGRSHRLETVNPALFDTLARADAADVDEYCREVTQAVAFGAGPELSPAAVSVARLLVSGRVPSVKEWAVLRREYESARLLAGSQRPGLTGIEEPDAVVRYMADYAFCRRLETLLCWESGTPADIVYAARAAEVVLPFGAVMV